MTANDVCRCCSLYLETANRSYWLTSSDHCFYSHYTRVITAESASRPVMDLCELVLLQTCKGQGGPVRQCGTCRGQGVQTSERRQGNTIYQTQTTCSACGGAGGTLRSKCGSCTGQGTINKRVNQSIEIPAGCQTGQQLLVQQVDSC